jgi:hypothetical protein
MYLLVLQKVPKVTQSEVKYFVSVTGKFQLAEPNGNNGQLSL